MIRNSGESKQLVEIENPSWERSSNFPRRPDRLPPALSHTHHIPCSNHQDPRHSLDSLDSHAHASSTPRGDFSPDFSSPPGFVHNPATFDERWITAHSPGHKSVSSSYSPGPHHDHGSRHYRVNKTNYGHSKILGQQWSSSSPQGAQGDGHTHDRGYDDDHHHHRYHHHLTTPSSSPQSTNHDRRHDYNFYHRTNSSFSPQGTNHDGGRIIEPPHARALSPVAAVHHPNNRELDLDYAPYPHQHRDMQAAASSSSLLVPGSGPERQERNFSTPPPPSSWSPPLGDANGRQFMSSTGMAPLDWSGNRVQEEERIFGSPVPGPYRMTDHDSPSYAQFKGHHHHHHYHGGNSGPMLNGDAPHLFRCDERASLLNLDRLPPHPRHSGWQESPDGLESPEDVYVSQGEGMKLRTRLMQAPAPRVDKDKGREEMRRELLDRVLNYGTKWLYTSPPQLTNTQLEDDRSCIIPVDPLVTKAVPHIPIMRDAFQFHALRMRKYTVKRTRGIVP